NAHFYQDIANLGVNVLGMYGPLHPDSKWAKLRGAFEYQLLATIPTTISGGSVEINRNIIATRGLGLPRQ
ncbi:MAG: acyl-CoA dehydrogenase, partial [Dehalococcoidia bacterium]